ncbi:hypothetical protein ASE75_13690 [Sphingomonas sp. Leaf17]|uniref:hypothetical protein n=1 Tax=Sphingomonas sp. Leaf17 TaxID=1735683 RepID=UPI0006FF901A|nr:hypothetical protein [Sphingomonas sp. Leaf17]KQM62677.1 hypothetical protein ASE75_13690 [Sphingomonas sp. Leaf17]
MGLFTEFTAARAAAKQVEDRREALADRLTVRWLATAIAARTDVPCDDIIQMLIGIASEGGPDLRTAKSMACASLILGVPGNPITPTHH